MESSEILLSKNQNESNDISNYKVLKIRKKRKDFLFNKTNIIARNKIINPKINNNDNKQIKKIRNPGIDIVRLLTMYCILITHSMRFGKAYSYFNKYERILRLIQSFLSWNNNAFILISGIVGYKTNKYSNLLYLWLIVIFYSVGIHKYIIAYKKEYNVNLEKYKIFYPMIFNLYWYFTTYFGMYLFLPVINKGISLLSKYEFRLVVMSTLGILVFWKDYKNIKEDVFRINRGNSVIWFLIFYLTGAYIGKYRVDYNGFKKYIYCFICGSIFTLASYIYFKLNIKEYYFFIGNKKIEIPTSLRELPFEDLNSVLKIVQSITLCLFFLQIHYNKYIAKIICFFGPLAFSIYLIYSNPIILKNVINKLFINQPRNSSLKSLLSLLLIKSFKRSIFCLVIDYLRHLLFSLLKIKNLLFFIEIKLKEKLS